MIDRSRWLLLLTNKWSQALLEDESCHGTTGTSHIVGTGIIQVVNVQCALARHPAFGRADIPPSDGDSRIPW
jgi:hypothetical protein